MSKTMSSQFARVSRWMVSCCSLAFCSASACIARLMAASETLLIGPGDLLHIQVLDTPEMEQTPRVTDAGVIPVEGVGA